jgi:NAD(P)-dependent dehydrogenase (short-subunit alcohol dehydrogenase family)
MEYNNKVVLITGGSRGIGKETAIKFSELGAQVIINYFSNKKAAKETLNLLKPGNHTIIQADIGDPKQLESMVKEVIGKYQHIDILVNNAGVAIDHPIENTSFEDWQKVWNKTIGTNLVGLANLSFLVAHQMIKRNQGKIINVSSRGAFRGEPENLAYGSSKGGLNSFSQSLAKALGKYNISVTAVAPGFVETDMGKAYLNTEKGEFLRNESPFKRVAFPAEVADTILFLASEKAKFLTGGIVDINGASFLRM